MEPVDLAELKQHLRIDGTGEDDYLNSLITAARRAIEHRTGLIITGEEPTLADEDRETVRQAMLLLIGNWYLNREGDAPEPYQIRWLIDPLKKWNDGSCD